MQQQENKNRLQTDENVQKNANALGNAKVSNNDPDGITREERTRQYGETENDMNKLDNRGAEPANYREDI